MRIRRYTSLAVILVLLALLNACALFTQLDVSGVWEGSIITDEVTFSLKLLLTQNDTRLSGHVTFALSFLEISVPVISGSVDGDTIYLRAEGWYEHILADEPGFYSLTFRGTASEGSMSGTVIFGTGVAGNWYVSR